MNRNAEILDELIALNSCLASMPWHVPFAVPEHYFADFVTAFKDSIHFPESEESMLSGFSRKLPFQIDPTYLDALGENMAGVAISANAVSGITSPFAVPEEYLQDLPGSLLNAVRAASKPVNKKTRVIQVRPHLARLGRIAAAAVLVLGIGFGSYSYLHPASAEQVAAKKLSKLDGAIIDMYVEQHVDEFDDETVEAAVATSHAELPATMSSLDAAEIQEYLQENGEIIPPTSGDKTL